MLGDDMALRADQDPTLTALHLNRPADEAEGHRVAVRAQTYEEVIRYHAGVGRLQPEGRVPGRDEERRLFPSEPIDRSLVSRPVNPLIGDPRRPG
jgi:hypothetical protein